jgi:hypothetical protein
MSTVAASPKRLSQVRHLTEALIDQVLEAQILGRPVLQEQREALIKAALFLGECNLPRWPMLTQVLHGLSPDTDEAAPHDATKAEVSHDVDLKGLSRLFATFGKDKA